MIAVKDKYLDGQTDIVNKGFLVNEIRKDFPILSTTVYGKPLIYLDNAATTQKPRSVIDTTLQYYSYENANIHRGIHYLSEIATQKYEEVREKVKQFINAEYEEEIIFVRGTTEAINLVASTFGKIRVKKDDEVLITGLEHHSNIVPWQMLCSEKGAKLKVVPINNFGEIEIEEFKKNLTEKVKIIAVTHVSNSLGVINPIKEIIQLAHRNNIPVLVDGAQAVAHLKVDVQKLGADFYAFSSHKVYGPTGVGVLYGKKALLDEMPPYQGGGDMIKSVTFEKTIFNDLPYKFEAGTPNIAGVIGFGSAIDYLNSIDLEQARLHENILLNYLTESLFKMNGLRIIGNVKEKVPIVSFIVDNIHPHDIGTILDREGIAVRTGHHCAQPVMEHFGIPAIVRVSLALYNTLDEIDRLVSAIKKAREILGHG